MNELHFKSSLTPEEIEDNFRDIDFFSGVMAGLEEALAYTHGKAKAGTIVRKRSLPTVCVVDVRTSLSMTQREFAEVLGVSCRTVEAWEAGKSTPNPTAKKLMHLIHEDPSIVCRL